MRDHDNEIITDPLAFWEDRYAGKGPTWSGLPNAALVREVDGLEPGSALDLGCGEGGDAIWLAQAGWAVTAIDISPSALALASRQAEAAGVAARIRFVAADLADWQPDGQFDLVSAQFLHSPVEFPRDAVLRRAASAVAPGGLLLVVGHGAFPHGSDHPHEDVALPTPDDVLASLALPLVDWTVVTKVVVGREAIGQDGSPLAVEDGVLSLRRNR